MADWREFVAKKIGVVRKGRRRRALAMLSRFPRFADAPRHSLDGDLIVSLTSYPPRFARLALTLKSLLDQQLRPDRTLLWIADGDMAELPPDVLALRDHGLEIRPCADVGSFKKILPALEAFPDSFILIADDDSYYPPGWLGGFVRTFDRADPTIVAGRTHRLVRDASGKPAPYEKWDKDVFDRRASAPSRDLLPTGNGGVLYPPGSLPPWVVDDALRRRLSPTCDDLWLFFAARQVGTRTRRIPGFRLPLVEWPGNQEGSLRRFHRGGRKDAIIRALSDHFGNP